MKEHTYQVWFITLNKVEDVLIKATLILTDGQNNLRFFDEGGECHCIQGSRWIRWKRVT